MKEKMDEFISVCPNGKPASSLDFRKFSVKGFREILKHYNENISGKKIGLQMRTFAIFCFQTKLQSQQLLSDLLLWRTLPVALKKLFYLVNV